MKASERLRQLDSAMIPPPPWEKGWGDADVLVDLRNALPLIADVVEAAEQLREANPANEFFEKWYSNVIAPTNEALTALTAALQPQTLTEAARGSGLTSGNFAEGSPPPPEGATAP